MFSVSYQVFEFSQVALKLFYNLTLFPIFIAFFQPSRHHFPHFPVSFYDKTLINRSRRDKYITSLS